MDSKLELKLVKKYPIIFRDYKGDMRKTCMAWGFCHADGWYKIIDDLCQDIDKIIGKKDIKVIADQVKEKFGTLRFYYHLEYNPSFFSKICDGIRFFAYRHEWGILYNKIRDFRKILFKSTIEKISDAVDIAEGKSGKICEICGEPGKQMGIGWIKTLCNKCNKEGK